MDTLLQVAKEVIALFKPPEKLKISEWADRERILSIESSAEPGRWFTSRALYQGGIMDAFSEENIETVVVMSSSQVGKTEIILNVIGYFISQQPSPMLVVMPTLELAEYFSKNRLAPMLRDTPCLRGKVKTPRAKGAENTTLMKVFPGGFLAIAGANSPASLAARPIRVLLMDEVDRFPASAGQEGDPVSLAEKRTTTFWNRKIGLFSTPTIKGYSRIELAYEQSDKRKYYVPCLHCGEMQYLKFSQLRWQKGKYATAVYVCEYCGKHLTDADKIRMVRAGQWIAEKETKKVAGFYLNELYSPWSSFARIARKYEESEGHNEIFKVFVNTVLGEPYEKSEEGEEITAEALYERRHQYGPDNAKWQVPMKALVLTCFVDVHADRLELEVVGWGEGYESWGIEYKIILGDTLQEETWSKLEEYIEKDWIHESGQKMKVAICGIDSGYRAEQVYKFVRKMQPRKVFACKGSSVAGKPIFSIPSMSSSSNKKSQARKQQIVPVVIGTDAAKDILFNCMKITEPGPKFMHYHFGYSFDYFQQLTAEKLVYRFDQTGKALRVWTKKTKDARNEALDIRVGNIAMLELINPSFEKLKELYIQEKKQEQPKQIKKRIKGWVHRW